MDLTAALIAGALAAATPLLLAGLGELISERAGVLNLGVEGMMLVGAVAAFAGTTVGGVEWGLLSGAAAGAALAAVFAVLTLSLQANQVATGLALTLFGIGLSALAGKPFIGASLTALRPVEIPVLSQLPLLGDALFRHNVLVYAAIAACVASHWLLFRCALGRRLRAVGESPESAHALGLHVLRVRYGATLSGGALAGLAGAYLVVAYTPMWVEQMTAGRGWIALALVVFATWRPLRLLAGAWLFGGVSILQFHAQGLGVQVPSQWLAMLPYAATIVVLVLISRDQRKIRLNAPAALGRPYHVGD